jgi:hypothetical protein
MSPPRRTLALLALALIAPAARAGGPPSPLRLIPAEADLVVEVRDPRPLAESLAGLPAWRELRPFTAFREAMDSTGARRFRQLVAYFEKQLGAPWPEVLDAVGGGGAALGVKFGPSPAPALLVIQGRDAEKSERFARLALEILAQELARREAKYRAEKTTYEGVETTHVGEDFHAAAIGGALLLANNEKALERGLDLHRGRGKSIAGSPGLAEAAALLPKGCLATLWLNMETARKAPGAQAVYKMPRDDPNLTVLFGGYLDLLGRSPFLAAGLAQEGDGYLLTVRMPKGRDGMGPDRRLHVPPVGQPGARPLLEPKGVLYSTSFYLDLARVWEDRAALFNDKQVKRLEEFDTNSGKFLSGVQLSKLLTRAGTYHRFVVAAQAKPGYTAEPQQRLPAFAFVTELREPEEFAKAMETVLRGAALFATTQVKLRLVEETAGGCQIVGYRFREDEPLKGDVNDIRFNFSPCFARVGDQFVWCSTIELCRELVGILQKEGEHPGGDAAAVHSRVYAAGVADLLGRIQDQLVTQAVLERAVPAETAAAEAKAFLALLLRLGDLTSEARYGENEFRYDVRFPVRK